MIGVIATAIGVVYGLVNAAFAGIRGLIDQVSVLFNGPDVGSYGYDIVLRGVERPTVDPSIDISMAQLLLNVAGHGPIDVDGLYGPGTTEAVRSYQRATGSPATGRMDRPLFDRLVADTADLTYLEVCGDGFHRQTVRPDAFMLSCPGISEFTDVSWSSWSALGAEGTGTFWAACPGFLCEGGGSQEPFDARIRLSNPAPLECGDATRPELFLMTITLEGEFWDEPNVITKDGPYC